MIGITKDNVENNCKTVKLKGVDCLYCWKICRICANSSCITSHDRGSITVYIFGGLFFEKKFKSVKEENRSNNFDFINITLN